MRRGHESPSIVFTPERPATDEPRAVVTATIRNGIMTVRSTTRVGDLVRLCADFHASVLITETAGGFARLVASDAAQAEVGFERR